MGDSLSGAAGGRLRDLEDLDVRHSGSVWDGQAGNDGSDGIFLLWLWCVVCVTQWEEIEKAVWALRSGAPTICHVNPANSTMSCSSWFPVAESCFEAPSRRAS